MLSPFKTLDIGAGSLAITLRSKQTNKYMTAKMPLPGRTWEDQGGSGSSFDPLSLPRGRAHNPLVRVVRLLVEDHVNRLIAFVTKLTFGLETSLRNGILLSGCSEVILKSPEGPGSTTLQLKTYILPMTPCVQWMITPSNLYGVVGALWAA